MPLKLISPWHFQNPKPIFGYPIRHYLPPGSMRIFIAQFFPLFLGHYDVAKEDELPNEDCGDSGVFPVKDSNSNSNLSPKLDRINRFLNDVSAIQNAEQANMLQFR